MQKKAHRLAFDVPMVKAILDGSKTETRRCPPDRYLKWQAGDLIYVCETHVIENTIEYAGYINYHIPDDRPVKIITNENDGRYELIPHYQATEPEPHITDCDDAVTRWTAGRFMPKWAARIWLEITEVEKQMLQSISWQEILNEGVKLPLHQSDKRIDESFVVLWDGINKKRKDGIYAWCRNPEVAVIKFKVICTNGKVDL